MYTSAPRNTYTYIYIYIYIYICTYIHAVVSECTLLLLGISSKTFRLHKQKTTISPSNKQINTQDSDTDQNIHHDNKKQTNTDIARTSDHSEGENGRFLSSNSNRDDYFETDGQVRVKGRSAESLRPLLREMCEAGTCAHRLQEYAARNR